MSKIGFLDSNGNLLAYAVDRQFVIGPHREAHGGQTMALRVDGLVVAVAEDVDGLRWVVSPAWFIAVDTAAIRRATLGDALDAPFAASSLVVLDA